MKDEKNSLQSEKHEGQQPNDSPKGDGKKKENSILTGLGCLAAIVIVGGLIWSVIFKWKKMMEIVGQAENGTFIGDHPTLMIILYVVAGVVSTEPGLLLNKNQKGYKLALVGKVPTKVCNEGGAIKRGDLLVSASVAGYAKKAGANPKPGTIIGKALENFSSNKKGTILVLVNLQ